ncbi:MAG: helix-turn-helix domain-containing protein [Rhodospirillales bacterium]|nr:helix-turn-helix domain-containing protein [Rhodospirillales bacterium]
MVEGQVEPQEATRVGDMLQQRRVRSGFDITEVSQCLRIRRAYLEAIEAGRFENLPGPVYAAGFLRTYASFLGLDPTVVERRFHAEVAGTARPAPLNFPLPVAETGAPKGGVLLAGGIIALLAYSGWYVTSMHRPDVATLAPPMLDQPVASRLTGQQTARPAVQDLAPSSPGASPARPDQLVLETPPPPVNQALSGQSTPAASNLRPVADISGAAPPASRSSDSEIPDQFGGIASPTAAQPPHISPTATMAQAAEPPAGGMALSVDPAARIVLRAKSDSWVEVRDPQTNSLLVARLLRAGDVYNVPDKPGLRLVTGNAGGLLVLVDGASAPPLGKEGAVRRGIALDPDTLRRGPEGGTTQ